MNKPKLRVPRAKPSVRHKTEKDYKRDDNRIKAFKCYKCGGQFFAYKMYDGKLPTCMECWDWKEDSF